jgi:hypothetical protein
MPPQVPRARAGLLKHAYLAACLQLGEIPTTRHADEIRSELLSLRAGSRRKKLPETPHADNLMIFRSFEEQEAPPLALVGWRYATSLAAEGTKEPVRWAAGLLLAGAFVVSWPFRDIGPSDMRKQAVSK